MNNQAQFDCLCAGIVVADHICEPIDAVPAPGELVLTPRMELSIGGCASNVAVDLVRLGRQASIVGRVGDDVFGRYCAETLQSAGVKTEHLSVSGTAETSGTLVINAKGEDRRFIHSVGANGEFTGAEFSENLIRAARVLYLGGYCLMNALPPEKVAEAFRLAQSSGVVTVLDVVIPGPGDYWQWLEPVLPFTDVFLPNEDEARLITGISDPLAQAEAFHNAGAKTAVVTCGGNGSLLVSETTRCRSASYSVDFIDGTGSGDAFSAGFIHGLLDERDAVTCLRYGSALGASCVQSAGATTGAFNIEELNAFVTSNELSIARL